MSSLHDTLLLLLADLYGCTGADNQKWMMPSACENSLVVCISSFGLLNVISHRFPPGLPDITSTTGQGSPQELQVAGYTTRPIPAGIWNGQWDKEKGDNCSIGKYAVKLVG